jgi:tetratricopeptide (TPR) repeat protein
MIKMKNYLFTALFLLGCTVSFAQKSKVSSALTDMNDGKLDKALQEINETVDPANKKAEKTVNWSGAWQARGEILEAISKSKDENIKKLVPNPVEEAYNSYMKAIELDEKGSNPILKMKMVNFLGTLSNSAVQAYQAENYEKATSFFEKILALESSKLLKSDFKIDTAIMFNTGLAAASSKQYDKAIKYFKECVNYGYQGGASYAQIIRSYQLKGDTAQAINTMKEAILKYPNEQNIQVQLINYYITHGQSNEALDYLDKAIEKEPSNSSFHLAKGVCLDKLGRQDDAINSYLKAIELKPDNPDAYYNISVIYVNRGVKQFEIANSVPTTEQARYEAEKNKADDQFRKAVPYLENAVKYKPDEADWKNQLKNIYYRLKMMDKYESLK